MTPVGSEASRDGVVPTDRWVVPLMSIGSVVLIPWLFGCLYLWRSLHYTFRQKLFATLILPGGLFASVTFLFANAHITCTVPAKAQTGCQVPLVANPGINVAILALLVIAPLISSVMLIRSNLPAALRATGHSAAQGQPQSPVTV